MFNLSEIKFIKNDEQHGKHNYSFVGIQRNKANADQLEFWLPLGFDDFNEKDFEEVKGFFFKMYRTFKIYLQKKTAENALPEEYKTNDRDGIIEAEDGRNFTNENKEQTVFYGKLNALDKIIEGYDELRISSLEKRQVRSHEIDYSKIHRYLHQAIYLDAHVIYLDEMNIAKNVLVRESPPILQLFCYIYTAIKQELGESANVADNAAELAEQFKESYLQPDSDLFGEHSFAQTTQILKEVLEDIDTLTVFKDEDYWHFFDACEAFLYGERNEQEEGIYWGFSSFYDIWEDMCQTYMLGNEKTKEKVIFADVNGRLENFHGLESNPFELSLNNEKGRYLRPDLVLDKDDKVNFNSLYTLNHTTKFNRLAVRMFFTDYSLFMYDYPLAYSKYNEVRRRERNYFDENKNYDFVYKEDFAEIETVLLKEIQDKFNASPIRIIDYKYMRKSDYQQYNPSHIDKDGKNKIKEDIHKQLVYEWAVQKNWKLNTESEFWIPFYHRDKDKKKIPISNHFFNESKIKVMEVNFKILQEFYLQQSL